MVCPKSHRVASTEIPASQTASTAGSQVEVILGGNAEYQAGGNSLRGFLTEKQEPEGTRSY